MAGGAKQEQWIQIQDAGYPQGDTTRAPPEIHMIMQLSAVPREVLIIHIRAKNKRATKRKCLANAGQRTLGATGEGCGG